MPVSNGCVSSVYKLQTTQGGDAIDFYVAYYEMSLNFDACFPLSLVHIYIYFGNSRKCPETPGQRTKSNSDF